MTHRYWKKANFLPDAQYTKVREFLPGDMYGRDNEKPVVLGIEDKDGRQWVAKRYNEGRNQAAEERTAAFAWVGITLLYRLVIGAHVPEGCVLLDKEDGEPIAYLNRQISNVVKIHSSQEGVKSLPLLEACPEPERQFAACMASWLIWDEQDGKVANLVLGDAIETGDSEAKQENSSGFAGQAAGPVRVLHKIDHDHSLPAFSNWYGVNIENKSRKRVVKDYTPIRKQDLRDIIIGKRRPNRGSIRGMNFIMYPLYKGFQHYVDCITPIRESIWTGYTNLVLSKKVFQQNFCFYLLKAALITNGMLDRVAKRAFPEHLSLDRKLFVKLAGERLTQLRSALIEIPEFCSYLANPVFFKTGGKELKDKAVFDLLVSEIVDLEKNKLEQSDEPLEPIASEEVITLSYQKIWQESLFPTLKAKAAPERHARITGGAALGGFTGGNMGLLLGVLALNLTMPWGLVSFAAGLLLGVLLAGIVQYAREENDICNQLQEGAANLKMPSWMSGNGKENNPDKGCFYPPTMAHVLFSTPTRARSFPEGLAAADQSQMTMDGGRAASFG
jgi:hypothetical protein